VADRLYVGDNSEKSLGHFPHSDHFISGKSSCAKLNWWHLGPSPRGVLRTCTRPVRGKQIPFSFSSPARRRLRFPALHVYIFRAAFASLLISARGLTASLRDAVRVQTFCQTEVGVLYHECRLQTRLIAPHSDHEDMTVSHASQTGGEAGVPINRSPITSSQPLTYARGMGRLKRCVFCAKFDLE